MIVKNCPRKVRKNFVVKGMMLEHTINQMPCTYALGAKAKTGMNEAGISGFDPNGSGEEIWQDLYENGSLTMKGIISTKKCMPKKVYFRKVHEKWSIFCFYDNL